MSTPLERRGEVLRLARVLGVDPSELDVLDGAGTAELRELRHAVADRLLDRSREQFSRAVQLGDLVPGPIAAKLSQHVMGPVLGGRAAALLTPQKAADLAKRLPPDFLADVACHVDIRKVQPLLAGIDRRTMADAGAHLRRREEWVVLGAFVGYVPDDVVADLLDGFDGEALLRSGVVIEDASRIDAVVGMLSEARLDGLLQAADEHGLWGDIVSLNVHLGDDQLRRVTDAVQRMSGARIEALAALLGGDDELRSAAAPIVERLTPVFLADVAARVDLQAVGPLLDGIPHATLAEAGAELERREQWELLGRLMVALDDDVLRTLVPAFGDDTLLRAGATIGDRARLEGLLALLPEERRTAELRGLAEA
ncbi:hypothetical protein [Patulibacter minatonensis]|uniref:hypothetical protein n=1 Tax=Patulibacter minatonensis TaxID=298163 RepID=UPI000685C5AB|nr:hypothetical protein [Patulibacter minatonensis]